MAVSTLRIYWSTLKIHYVHSQYTMYTPNTLSTLPIDTIYSQNGSAESLHHVRLHLLYYLSVQYTPSSQMSMYCKWRQKQWWQSKVWKAWEMDGVTVYVSTINTSSSKVVFCCGTLVNVWSLYGSVTQTWKEYLMQVPLMLSPARARYRVAVE